MHHQADREEIEYSLRALQQKQHILRKHSLHLNQQLIALSLQRQALGQEARSIESIRRFTALEQKLLSHLEAVRDMQEQLQQEQAMVEQPLAAWHRQVIASEELAFPPGNS